MTECPDCESETYTVTGGFTTALLIGALAFSGVAVAGYPVLAGGSATLLLVLIAVWLSVSSKYDLVQNHSNG